MSVRKVNDGRAKPWLVDYRDQDGKRKHAGFRTKKAADAYYRQVSDELEQGIHNARADSMTFGDALDDWLQERAVAIRLATK
jgi:hypothetical protein